MMLDSVKLITPIEGFAKSYGQYVQELQDLGEKPVPFVLEYSYQEFGELIRHLSNDAAGINLQEWQVPCSTYWLVDGQSEILAVSNLRHVLNDNLLRLGGHIGYGVRPSVRRKGLGTVTLSLTLEKAREKEIRRVLITCSNNNVGSIRVIKNNGGVLLDEEYLDSEKDIVKRFWIDL